MIKHAIYCKRFWHLILQAIHLKNCFTLNYFASAGREEWAAGRETKAEGREREPGAADQVPELPPKPGTAPSCDPSLCLRRSPRAGSCWSQADDACDWLPWVPDVAVHATFWCWHLKWPQVLPSCRISKLKVERGDAALHWFKSSSVCSVIGVVDSRTWKVICVSVSSGHGWSNGTVVYYMVNK